MLQEVPIMNTHRKIHRQAPRLEGIVGSRQEDADAEAGLSAATRASAFGLGGGGTNARPAKLVGKLQDVSACYC